MRPRSRIPIPLPLLSLGLAWLALAPAALGHTGTEIGEYVVEVGWRGEPAFVGQPNAVQVIVRNHADDSPVLDGVALQVVVQTAGQQTEALTLAPDFDAEERAGSLGEYGVPLVPTAPGDYTFHITGTLPGSTSVDLSLTSGEDTFDAVVGSSDAEFPVRLPNLGEVATRLDRIDARIAALASTDPRTDALDAARAATSAAESASAAADRALVVGSAVGAAGILAGLVGVVLALRAGRRSQGTA